MIGGLMPSFTVVRLFPLTALLLFLAGLLALPPGVRAEDTFISGSVRAAEGGSLDGLVLIEKGRLYGKDFRYGGLIKDGRFSVKVDGGGPYGLHLYATGYVYFPLGLEVEAGRDNSGSYKLPPNPASGLAPAIDRVSVEEADGSTSISLHVSDPNDDLSHQVLALNSSTGEGFRMDPPGLVLPFTRNYPEGEYTLLYEREPTAPEAWFFVAADNKCYSSPVLKAPFTKEGFVPGRPVTDIRSGGGGGPGEGPVTGKNVFVDNCSMCHLADSERAKVGPGMKGLYSRDRTPALGNPVTDSVIREQIKQGGLDMPPYAHLTEEEIRAVMEYLKTL